MTEEISLGVDRGEKNVLDLNVPDIKKLAFKSGIPQGDGSTRLVVTITLTQKNAMRIPCVVVVVQTEDPVIVQVGQVPTTIYWKFRRGKIAELVEKYPHLFQ